MDKAKSNVGLAAFLSRADFGAHPETVDHINRKIFRSFHGSRTGEVPADIFKLRYQVYCLECAFLQPKHYLDEMELDDYDEFSTHFAAYTMDEHLVGSVRLVQPGEGKRYPFELHCNTFEQFEMPPREQVAEISRLVVKKSHRRRRADNVLDVPGILSDQPDAIELPPEVERRDRTSSMLLLGMYREMFRHSRQHGIRYWLAAMERSLVFALNKMGFRFSQIGPQANYYGAVTPYMLDLDELFEKLDSCNPVLAAWFHEKPLVFANNGPSRLQVVRNTDLDLCADIDQFGHVVAETMHYHVR
jgi:N-acyl amino acid synthase of PEP-CTERM/exosortase system